MNNVGALTRGLPDHIPVHEWHRIFDINLFSVVRSNDVFLPLLVEQGSGHIVNTASFAGLYTYAYDRLPYAAAKAAVVQLSEGLALYLRPKHRCHVAVPGAGPDQHRGVSSTGLRSRDRDPGSRSSVRVSRTGGCR